MDIDEEIAEAERKVQQLKQRKQLALEQKRLNISQYEGKYYLYKSVMGWKYYKVVRCINISDTDLYFYGFMINTSVSKAMASYSFYHGNMLIPYYKSEEINEETFNAQITGLRQELELL